MPKILIVEDDAQYSKVYKHKFEISGYEVATAEDGEVALTKMKQSKPDIALVDLMMPKMDGFQLMEVMKSDANLKDIPIVVLTNLSTPDGTERVLEKGVYSIMIKADNDPDAILAKVNAVLGNNK